MTLNFISVLSYILTIGALHAGSENTVNLSLELNPGFFSVATGAGSNLDVNINSFGVLLGYQHL